MTVSELIQALWKVDPDLKVYARDSRSRKVFSIVAVHEDDNEGFQAGHDVLNDTDRRIVVVSLR